MENSENKNFNTSPNQDHGKSGDGANASNLSQRQGSVPLNWRYKVPDSGSQSDMPERKTEPYGNDVDLVEKEMENGFDRAAIKSTGLPFNYNPSKSNGQRSSEENTKTDRSSDIDENDDAGAVPGVDVDTRNTKLAKSKPPFRFLTPAPFTYNFPNDETQTQSSESIPPSSEYTSVFTESSILPEVSSPVDCRNEDNIKMCPPATPVISEYNRIHTDYFQVGSSHLVST